MSFNRSTWSAASSGANVSVAGHAPVLRKQRSCSDSQMLPAAGGQPMASGVRMNVGTCGRTVLRKQASVDQATSRGRYNAVHPKQQDSITFPAVDSDRSETHVRILSTNKKRVPGTSNETESTIIERMPDNSSSIQALQHRRDDRINLNIFLTTASNSQEGEPSDLDSEKESSVSSKTNKAKPLTVGTEDLGSKEANPKVSVITAADRRAAFQSSKTILSVTGERRPPLIRAMSAPIRPSTDDGKSTKSQRRPIRRRRIGRDRSTDNFGNNDFILETPDEDGGLDSDADKLKAMTNGPARKASQMPPRSRSVMGGCDVVTLVSLLSSGGSDSEKEEPMNNSDIAAVRAPMLRKSGKSVSFQESENVKNVNGSTSREFPMMLRRASIAPLAARIRANRPPTAPPGSIYMRQEFGANSKTSTTILKDESAPCAKTDRGDSDKSVEAEIQYEDFPEYCRTKKERDCWTLFQKMSKKGVSVSYDTILRGMLTPTEMRGVLKQREHDAEKLLLQQMADEAEAGAKPTGKPFSGPQIVGCS